MMRTVLVRIPPLASALFAGLAITAAGGPAIPRTAAGSVPTIPTRNSASARPPVADMNRLELEQCTDDMLRSRERSWIDAIASHHKTTGPILTPDGSRWLAEARVYAPHSEQHARQLVNVRAALADGYAGVWLVWRGEPAEQTAVAARELRRAGAAVALVFGPPELGENAGSYYDLSTVRRVLFACLQHCALFVPHWRKSSAPHGDPAKLRDHANVLADIAVSVAPNVPVCGELTLTRDRGAYSLVPVIPDAAGAVIVLNAGYSGVRCDRLSEMVRTVTHLPAILLVIGPRAYYRTFFRVDVTDRGAWVAKRSIERDAVGGGFAGTVTLMGDGSDGRQANDATLFDDIGRELYHQEGKDKDGK